MAVSSAILLALTACAQPTPSPSPSLAATSSATPAATSSATASWPTLERALTLPSPNPGQTCPKSSGRVVSPSYGAALGAGPVYPVGLGANGVLEVGNRAGRYLQKVLWVSAASYDGPIVIRGARLDKEGWVKFSEGGSAESDELRLDESSTFSPDQEPGWRAWPSYTYVSEPAGCYGYQVDGADFAEIIVFEVKPHTG